MLEKVTISPLVFFPILQERRRIQLFSFCFINYVLHCADGYNRRINDFYQKAVFLFKVCLDN
jgi:hypothetical protein